MAGVLDENKGNRMSEDDLNGDTRPNRQIILFQDSTEVVSNGFSSIIIPPHVSLASGRNESLDSRQKEI